MAVVEDRFLHQKVRDPPLQNLVNVEDLPQSHLASRLPHGLESASVDMALVRDRDRGHTVEVLVEEEPLEALAKTLQVLMKWMWSETAAMLVRVMIVTNAG